MVKASLISENNLRYDPYLQGLGDDIIFTLYLYEFVKRVSYIQEVIYHYRVLDNSYSHGYKANYLEKMERIFEKQNEFLIRYDKDDFMRGSFYTRVLIYLYQGMNSYFRNKNNPKDEKTRYLEFRELIQTWPYKDAIKKAPVKYMGRRRLKYSTLLLRLGLYKLYWKFV